MNIDALVAPYSMCNHANAARARTRISCAHRPGFEISAKFRRNSAKNFVFASYREKNFGIFRKISFENSKFKKFRPKVTEIRRNLPKFRNEISFPLNTGICNENEMVNPDVNPVSLQTSLTWIFLVRMVFQQELEKDCRVHMKNNMNCSKTKPRE